LLPKNRTKQFRWDWDTSCSRVLLIAYLAFCKLTTIIKKYTQLIVIKKRQNQQILPYLYLALVLTKLFLNTVIPINSLATKIELKEVATPGLMHPRDNQILYYQIKKPTPITNSYNPILKRTCIS
jgi:hypothetical protein